MTTATAEVSTGNNDASAAADVGPAPVVVGGDEPPPPAGGAGVGPPGVLPATGASQTTSELVVLGLTLVALGGLLILLAARGGAAGGATEAERSLTFHPKVGSCAAGSGGVPHVFARVFTRPKLRDVVPRVGIEAHVGGRSGRRTTLGGIR
ncbi:LPXTG cell wall anchor domain-containing protein [Nocardioides sp. CGMCC 1.13656]|uniref:LPXTG cell wall anchor domain-containing protein n=1 Tax=Nocardioides TaxID=1839 RepID=UPI0012F81FD7|nr:MULTISPECIES: LPXTG cell wall anchor domain-containing protein [unclassified Nocardioides]MBA2955913.1 LPXTG cell wall anchor domain-containing protein [Nocardioides sp. CGMCC 1.13656]